jgi:hypothetical protein
MQHIHVCEMYLLHIIHYRYVSTTVAVIFRVIYNITKSPNELRMFMFIAVLFLVLLQGVY